MKILSAEFVTSAAGAAGMPRDGVPQIAMVGRSNVGKSSLINALVRKSVARTSGAAGKTRLINFYLVTFDPFAPVDRLYLVDLPGYGYARGGDAARAGFAALMEEYFAHADRAAAGTACSGPAAVLHIVDARHPGLPQDVAAREWIGALARDAPASGAEAGPAEPLPSAVVASKIDKLSRAERARALQRWTQTLKVPVLAVSAATGEGLDELWTLIVKLLPPPRTRSARRAPTRP